VWWGCLYIATHLHRRKYTFCGNFINMLASVLSFSPELADQVSEYCEEHSDGTYLLVVLVSSSLQAALCSFVHLNSASPAYQTTLGLHVEELCRCGQDVISFAGPMDDLDGPMDRSKKRFVVHMAPTPGPSLLAQDRNLTFPLSCSSGSRHVQRILCACMVRRHQGDTGGDCDAGIER